MKIRSKLIFAFLLLSLIPLLLTSILYYSNNKKSRTLDIINHLESVASIQQNRIQSIVFHNIERLDLVASRTQLRISLGKYIQTGKKVHQVKMNRILEDAKRSISDFYSICIANLDGTIVASTDTTKLGKKNQDKEWFLSGMSKKKSRYVFS